MTTLAFRLWDTSEAYLRQAELADVASALEGLADTQLSRQQATHAVGAGSLLVRTDEGLFGFIHASVMEWLVANEIARQVNAGEDPPALHRKTLSQLTVDFVCDLADPARCEAWAHRVLVDAELLPPLGG